MEGYIAFAKGKVLYQLLRTDNSIKNYFYSTVRRCLRRISKLFGEKRSTRKIKNVKPVVLSKIIEDQNLT
jgi:L-rhamnose isomerase